MVIAVSQGNGDVKIGVCILLNNRGLDDMVLKNDKIA